VNKLHRKNALYPINLCINGQIIANYSTPDPQLWATKSRKKQ
jgi:hypothetical protein